MPPRSGRERKYAARLAASTGRGEGRYLKVAVWLAEEYGEIIVGSYRKVVGRRKLDVLVAASSVARHCVP